ncbi:UPF0193 protein EVG1 homolog [Rhynchophorus ferrugineus]|uniref:Uncharacterized protein n=1 Tax=Rhynchophorus ferrugineus TaxID=354439 RepID=A0A834IDU9_RHYFE|nr:hypothetical protein GWI33_007813 [Rhynchophorus ferrugineus]
MQWPSNNVPNGGIFHPAKTSYSPDTHQFIKVLMEESKMSMMQRKKVDYFLRNGEPLPPLGRQIQNYKNTISKVTIRPGSSKRRSRQSIISSGAYEIEPYRPTKPGIDRQREIDKLANKMAYNGDINVTKAKVIKKIEMEEVKPPLNRFDQLVEEIREREEWLKEMEQLGQGDKYRLIIEQQIQNKVRDMEKLKISTLN